MRFVPTPLCAQALAWLGVTVQQLLHALRDQPHLVGFLYNNDSDLFNPPLRLPEDFSDDGSEVEPESSDYEDSMAAHKGGRAKRDAKKRKAQQPEVCAC